MIPISWQSIGEHSAQLRRLSDDVSSLHGDRHSNSSSDVSTLHGDRHRNSSSLHGVHAWSIAALLHARRQCKTVTKNKSALTRTSFSAWDFVVIGVQKAGTTDLTGHLQNHPELCALKEVRLKLGGNGIINWKADKSKTDWRCGSECARIRGGVDANLALNLFNAHGEGMASALWLQEGVKLILLLREPIRRTFSAYQMAKYDQHFRFSRRYESFDECVSFEAASVDLADDHPHYDEVNGTVFRGLYAPVLKRLSAAGFMPTVTANKANRLLVLISEWIMRDEAASHDQIFAFLGVSRRVTAGWASTPYPSDQRAVPSDKMETLSLASTERLFSLYRRSTLQTYQMLSIENVPEWEAYYASMQLLGSRDGALHGGS